MISAYLRRWFHQLRNFPRCRAITWTEGFHGPVVKIACSCGRVFWQVAPLAERTRKEP